MLVIGTSSVVQPEVSLVLEAKSGGTILAEINPEITPNSRFMDFVFNKKTGEIVPKLVKNGQ